MENVTDYLVYHISRNNGGSYKQFVLNQTVFFGNTKNSFFSFYDQTARNIFNPQDEKWYSILYLARKAQDYLVSGIIDPELESFRALFDSKAMIEELIITNEHYMKYTREVIFEEVRREFFSHLPSRQKCLWVIPIDQENKSLKYWNGLLKNSSSKILKLKLTGKIHRANQDYLSLSTNSLNYIREQAFKYWNGTQQNENERDELLFEGFATYIDDVQLD